MIIYIPKTEFENGKWYDTFEVPDDMPLSSDWVITPPPENYKYPKFDYITMTWQEDKDRVLVELTKENTELKSRLDMTEGAVLDLATQIMTR